MYLKWREFALGVVFERIQSYSMDP